jgi:N-acetylglutamate synthase-like GNAT family acetyltransferase
MVSETKRLEVKQDDMSLIECSFSEISHFASKAAKEKVKISETKNTMWFGIFNKDVLVGCCGLILVGVKCRFKAAYIVPEQRGKGLGSFATESRINIADSLGFQLLEVLTVKPSYYSNALGFQIHKQVRKGVWLGTKKL